jgi:hypothetical protein
MKSDRKPKEHNCLNCETAKKPGWKGMCGTCPPLEDSGVRARVREDASMALLTDAIKEVDRLRAENEKLTTAINDRGACMCGFLRIECKSHAAIRKERDEAKAAYEYQCAGTKSRMEENQRLRAENEKMKSEAKDHKVVAVMLSTENERLQEENAKLRADFPPAPPLPVHECKCYACEYLRRKQKEDRDKQEKK